MAEESFRHAVDYLRVHDRDRYLAALVLPQQHRNAAMALYAFNADVAAIRERVSNPAPGEIRLQWWSDALTGEAHGSVRSNPLADALLDTLATYRIPATILQRLLNARRFDLYDDPMPDLQSFEGYAGETASTLYQLVAMVLNGGAEVETGDAAGHLGVAHVMLGHLRAFGRVSAQGRIMLPWSIFAANGVREGEIFAGQASEGLLEAIGQLTEMAGAHLAKAERAIAALPAELKPACASLVLLKGQHGHLVRHAGGPFVAVKDDPDWRKIVRLWWWALRPQ